MSLIALLQEKPLETSRTRYIVKEEPNNYNPHKQEMKKKRRVNLLKRIPLQKLMDLKVDYGATCSVTTR